MFTHKPFISDQRLMVMNHPEGSNPVDYLTGVSQVTERSHPLWMPVLPNRSDFLANAMNRRLVITSDAGIGKTTALHETRILRSHNRQHLCILLDVSKIEHPHSTLLDIKKPSRSLLVRELCSVIPTDPRSAQILISQQIKSGEFTLLVDGLDQIGIRDKQAARNLMAPISEFLVRHPEISVVIGSRPWAIGFFEKELFERFGPWKICRVEPFTNEQIRNFLGNDRFLALKGVVVDLLPVPRMLARVYAMPIDELSYIQSAADIYWKSLQPDLQGGLDRQIVNVSLNNLVLILSLMGWTMVRHKLGVSIAKGKDFDDFVNEAWKLGTMELERHDITRKKSLRREFGKVAALNMGVGYALLSNPEMTEVVWQDKSLRDFFAAVWITRYGDEDTRQWLVDNPCNIASDEYHPWRFAAGMPANQIVRDDGIYASAMATLYKRPCHPGESRRSSEMIYHSLGNMLQIAGLINSWNGQPIDYHAPIEMLKKMTTIDFHDQSPSGIAKTALHRFFTEFELIRQGTNGHALQKVAELIETNLVNIPSSELRTILETLYDRQLFRHNDSFTWYDSYVISAWLNCHFGDIHKLTGQD